MNRPNIFFDFLISFLDRVGCIGSRTLSKGETKLCGRSFKFSALKRTDDDPAPCRCCTLDVDETNIEVSEEALNLTISSSCDGGNERGALCLGVEEAEGKLLGKASTEAHEESSDKDSDSDSADSETATGWEIVGSRNNVQLFLPSGCDKRSELGQNSCE